MNLWCLSRSQRRTRNAKTSESKKVRAARSFVLATGEPESGTKVLCHAVRISDMQLSAKESVQRECKEKVKQKSRVSP